MDQNSILPKSGEKGQRSDVAVGYARISVYLLGRVVGGRLMAKVKGYDLDTAEKQTKKYAKKYGI
jgi:hypothetical protein